jgi:hypothetical protein
MRFLTTISAWLPRLLVVALGLSLVAGEDAAAASPPAGMSDAAGPAGGRLLTGFAPATSPAALFRTALADTRSAFGPDVRVLSATRSTDGALTVGLFRVNDAAAPLAGLILASYARSGSSRIAIVYDRAERFATTAPSLIARATPAAAQTATASAGPLRDARSPDGSVRALVPPAWKLTIFAQGELSASGPDGAEVDQEVSAHMIDPRSPLFQQALQMQSRMSGRANPFGTPYGIPLTYEPDPARAFIAFARIVAKAQGLGDPAVSLERTIPQPQQQGLRVSELVGTDTVKGTRMRFDGIVAVTPASQTGGWMMSVKMISAPVAAFQRDLPALAAIYNSYRVDQGVRGQQVQQTIAEDQAGAARGLALMQQTQAQNTATFDASMSHARLVQSSIDRSTAGFTRYLSDTTVVENATTGAHTTVNDSFADAVVKNDPQNFRVVPVSEYRQGTDF